MANAKKCDACGAFYERYDDVFETILSVDNRTTPVKMSLRPIIWETHKDLCPECLKSVVTGLANRITA